MIVRPRRGPPPLADLDRPFIGTLFQSCDARAYLDNMASSRSRSERTRRTLTRAELEVRLDDSLIIQGPGLSQVGFSLFAGAAWRVRAGEIEANLRFITLSTGDTDAGWQGSGGGGAATVGAMLPN